MMVGGAWATCTVVWAGGACATVGGGAAAAGSTMTFCSGVLLSCPLASARARSRWMPAITSFCCARNASPSFCSQSSLSFSIVSTWGKKTSDFTLSSQVYCLSASLS